jgi:hypothetical protein
MLLLASETASGLKVQHWLDQLVVLMWEPQGRLHGLAFWDDIGEVIRKSDYEEVFYAILQEIQD